MSYPTKCNQSGCDRPAAHRFTWPGRDEAGICEHHVAKLRAVAAAMGFSLQIIKLETDELTKDGGS